MAQLPDYTSSEKRGGSYRKPQRCRMYSAPCDAQTQITRTNKGNTPVLVLIAPLLSRDSTPVSVSPLTGGHLVGDRPPGAASRATSYTRGGVGCILSGDGRLQGYQGERCPTIRQTLLASYSVSASRFRSAGRAHLQADRSTREVQEVDGEAVHRVRRGARHHRAGDHQAQPVPGRLLERAEPLHVDRPAVGAHQAGPVAGVCSRAQGYDVIPGGGANVIPHLYREYPEPGTERTYARGRQGRRTTGTGRRCSASRRGEHGHGRTVRGLRSSAPKRAVLRMTGAWDPKRPESRGATAAGVSYLSPTDGHPQADTEASRWA